jgi:hypothetical protein
VFTVFNPLNYNRSELVTVHIEMPAFFFYNTFINFMACIIIVYSNILQKVEVYDLDSEIGKSPNKVPAHPISPMAHLGWEFVLPGK